MERVQGRRQDDEPAMIDELLKLSRLDRQPGFAHATVDLSAVAHEIVAELRGATRARRRDV